MGAIETAGSMRVKRASELAAAVLPWLRLGSPEKYGAARLALALPRLLQEILIPI